MRLAAGDSADTVSRDMGNSPRVLLSHYYEMIGTEEAEKFWRLIPPIVRCQTDQRPRCGREEAHVGSGAAYGSAGAT